VDVECGGAVVDCLGLYAGDAYTERAFGIVTVSKNGPIVT
jgi:hypothetical protein